MSHYIYVTGVPTDTHISSFFQGLCVLGYCVAPLNIAALVSTFVRLIYVRIPVALAAWAWCVWGTLRLTGLDLGLMVI